MQWAGQEKAESSTKHAVLGFASRGHPLPAVALTGVLGDSITSLWMDLGRGFLCLAPAGRGLISVSMSFISFSCFLLRYSCLINSRRALSSSFFMRSSSAFSLLKKTDIAMRGMSVDLVTDSWVGYYLVSSFFCSSSASRCCFLCWLSTSLLSLFSRSVARFMAMLSSSFISSLQHEHIIRMDIKNLC